MKSLIPLLALLLAACGGTVTLSITDAPIDDAENVRLVFTAVELERENGEVERIEFSTPLVITNALELQGGQTELLLDEVRVAEGDYVEIRLKMNASGTGTTGSTISIRDEAGARPLVFDDDADDAQVERGFTVDEDADLKLVIDFDLRRSIRRPREPFTLDEPYVLDPKLRLFREDEIGRIAGSVDESLLENCDAPAVYAFSNQNVTPTDVNGDAGPFNTALVADGNYTIAMLSAGEYTVAFTCDADEDQPATDDSEVTFSRMDPVNVTVVAQQTSTANLVPATR